MKTLIRALLGGLITMFLAGPSWATIVGGNVTLGSGSFIKLSPGFPQSNPDNTVGNDTFQNNNLYGFDEDQNIAIGGTVSVNIGTSPTAGQVVASHYIFFDPNGGASQRGFVDFDANIFGIITSTGLLAASDFLANTGVTYLNPSLRGLESGDSVWIDGGNASRLRVDWFASTPGDYVRVLTMRSPTFDSIPEPGTLALFGFGLAGLGFMARRKAKKPA